MIKAKKKKTLKFECVNCPQSRQVGIGNVNNSTFHKYLMSTLELEKIYPTLDQIRLKIGTSYGK
jgi:hypothetical protein